MSAALAKRALSPSMLCYVLAAAWAVFAAVSLVLGRIELAALLLAAGAAAGLVDEVCRRARRPAWLPHLLAAVSIGSIVVIASVTGQAHSSLAWYLPLVGLYAGQAAGLRATIGWVLAGVVTLGGLWVWERAAPIEPLATYGPLEATINAITVAALALGYSAAARWAYAGQLAEREQREAKVTEQARQLESMRDELQAAHARAVEAAEAKSRLMARVSHELRTPLNGLMGLTEILGDAPLPAAQAEIVSTLRASAGTLLQLVNDLLDVTQLEEGTLEVTAEPVRLRDLVGDVVDTFANVAERKDLRFAAIVEGTVPASVMIDGLRVRQILSNLVNNALKFTERGEVVVRLDGRVEDRVFHGRVSVTDTGRGIAESKLSGLFHAFGQLDDPVQLRRQGSGLGLWIARQLASSLGGELEVESTPGEGSTFTLALSAAVRETNQLRESGLAMLGLPVLAIEPHAASREALTELARYEGLELTAVARLEDADAGASPSVVLVDLAGHDEEDTAAIVRRFDKARLVAGVPASYVGPPPTGFTATTLKPYRASRLRAVLFDVLPSAEPGPEEPRTRRMRVLVIDDDPTNRMVARMFLERAGQEVEVVGTANEAWGALSTGDFDVAFVDVHLPDESGLSLASHVRRELDPAGRLWMVALTAAATEEDRKRCFEAGMDDFVAKPIQVGLFRAALERAGRMSRRRRRSSVRGVPVVAQVEEPIARAAARAAPRGAFDFDQPTFDALAEALEEDIVPLVTEYIDNGARLLGELRETISQDKRTAHRAVHTLASGSAMLGASGTARIARSIEARLQEGRSVSAAELAVLESAFADTSERLRAMDLSRRPADGPGIG